MAQVAAGNAVAERSSALNLALWVVQIATAGMFLMAGVSKLAGAPAMAAMFDKIGIGQWFRYLTGALEVLGPIVMLIPATAGLLGAALLALVMIAQ